MTAPRPHIGFTVQKIDAASHIHTPKGTLEEPWWREPEPGSVSLERAANLLAQVREPGGRHTCHLTSQLNGWVMRGELEPEEAAYIQAELTYDARFDSYWEQTENRMGDTVQGWPSTGIVAAYAVREVIGRTMPQAVHGSTEIPDLLAAGQAVVLSEISHSQLAFMPEEDPRPYVHDPRENTLTAYDHVASVEAVHVDPIVITM